MGEGLSGKVAFGLKFVKIWEEKSVPGSRNSMFKGPEVGLCLLACGGDSQEASVARAE